MSVSDFAGLDLLRLGNYVCNEMIIHAVCFQGHQFQRDALNGRLSPLIKIHTFGWIS